MSMTEQKITLTIDAKGLSCPMPIVRTAQAVKKLEPGDVAELFATDPGSQSDVPAWCRATGNELVATSETAGVYRFVIVKR